MNNLLSLVAVGAMFTGSVMADSSQSLEQQKMEIQMQTELNTRAAIEGTMPESAKEKLNHDTQHANEPELVRDIVGMPYDDKPSGVSTTHVIDIERDETRPDTQTIRTDYPTDLETLENAQNSR
ncbi:MAG: hypothetical protein MK052_12290 [Alphaproteobacteria bacterium]|nr:hypothetical protein [Alphaproteobacteria bacterium]